MSGSEVGMMIRRGRMWPAISECIDSGIKVVMITGDYEVTAEAIARKIGLLRLPNPEIINGKKLNELSDREVVKKISERETIFARIAPDQKLRIATMLKKSGFVIAMTGDGVNDAPALKKADIRQWAILERRSQRSFRWFSWMIILLPLCA